VSGSESLTIKLHHLMGILEINGRENVRDR